MRKAPLGVALTAATATLTIGAAGIAPSAAVAESLKSCPNKSLRYNSTHVLIKDVKVQNLTCVQGYQILREAFSGTLPPGYQDGPGSFPVPEGFFGQIVSNGSKKIQFAVPGD